MESLCNGKMPSCSVHTVTNSLIVLVAWVLIAVTETGIIPPVKVGFYCGDPSFSHRNNGDTVTPVVLFVSITLLLIAIPMGTEILRQKSFERKGLIIGLYIFIEANIGANLTLLITSFAKVLLGEHRPHFFETCQPDTAINCTKGAFVEDYTCTTTDKYPFYTIADSSLSFPSGHSSVSWYVAVYLSYVIQERLPTYLSYLTKPFLISICLTFSTVCSLTRITDRQHHWWDVLGGTILGILVALNSARLTHQYFSNLEEHQRKVINMVSSKPCRSDRDDQRSIEEGNLVHYPPEN